MTTQNVSEEVSRQSRQDEMVREAKKIAGVEEVLAVYERVQKYAVAMPNRTTLVVKFATGGNV